MAASAPEPRREFELGPSDNARLANLCGPLDENLRLLETSLGVRVHRRGDTFRVSGAQAASVTSASFSWDNLSYQGGPVMHSSDPYLIFWAPGGETIPSPWQSLIERYFTDVAGDSTEATTVYATARQYTDSTGFADYRQSFDPAGQVVQDADPYPAEDATNCATSPYTTCLTDEQLQAEISSLIAADGRPLEAHLDPGLEPAWTAHGGEVVLFEGGEAYAFSRPHSAGEDAGHAGDGQLRAPMPGRIVLVAAKAGDRVDKGQPLVTLEAMKMEHAQTAPFDARVAEVLCAAGDQVSEGALLMRLEPAD